MKFWQMAVTVSVLLAGCGGNPLNNVTSATGTSSGSTTGATGTIVGTTSATAASPIVHYEAVDSAGNGYATGYAYDATTDTFSVDNLAFDGGNVYNRSTVMPNLGPAKVYESVGTYPDAITGTPINQFQYRALYAKSASGQTQFAIVRTGSYAGYGFGGFVYQRNGSVTLPTSGQAHYSGTYAGLRDFNGQSGLEYTTGDMTMAIDFSDFNNPTGVQGHLYNRRIYDMSGTDITAGVLSALSTSTTVNQTVLPTVQFSVGPGVLSPAGEITSGVTSYVATGTGPQVLESGTYYAVLSGTNASEVVGIIVMTSTDPRVTGGGSVTVRETGGFILQRP